MSEYTILFGNYIMDIDNICSSILLQLDSKNIYKKVIRKIQFDLTTFVTYNIYDSNNYLIFKIEFGHFLLIDDKIVLGVEFTYSSSTFNYWTQLANEKKNFILKLNESKHFVVNLSKINLINDFINSQLKKHNYLGKK